MISAVVLTPDSWTGADLAREREVVVRSLVWLVSAVVSGVVRDVTLAVPAGLGLGELADQSGCALVQADAEPARLAAAMRVARESRLVVVKAGFQPDPGLVEEIDIFVRREPGDAVALVLSTPATVVQRLFPQRSACVGLVVSRGRPTDSGGFDRLVRANRARGTALQSRARPIL